MESIYGQYVSDKKYLGLQQIKIISTLCRG